jgi:secreted PhoX family phosphatase
VHEAIAVDPLTEIIYETEDSGTTGLFRFVPIRRRGARGLLAGRPEMLAVVGHPNYDTRTGETVGVSLPVEWVAVDKPDPDLATGEASCFAQGWAHGGAVFSRLAGASWSATDNAVYVNATDGGNARAGQVWCYQPTGSGGTLTLIYESPGPESLLKPDNITVSPRGGILICEDPDRAKQAYLRGLTPDGVLYDFASTSVPAPSREPRRRRPGTNLPARRSARTAGGCS